MKKIIVSICGLLAALLGMAQPVDLSTDNMSLLLVADKGAPLRTLYFGPKISGNDSAQLYSMRGLAQDSYPAFGQGTFRDYAISVKHQDGNMSLDLSVDAVRRESTADAQIVRIDMKDSSYPFVVTACYKAYKDVDMIEAWTEISHSEKKGVELLRFDSATLPIHVGDVWVSHLYGAWANEARLVQEPLNPGSLLIENRDGVRNAQYSHAEVMFSLDGQPRENSGAVIGAALCYSGNYRLEVVTKDSDYHTFFAGICPDNSSYMLEAGETFVTPALAFTWSSEGMSGASRNFHRWARAHALAHGNVERRILLNSWEGVYFDINEEGMAQMMSDIASMGGELFVMDDGWFGDKYPRKNDSSSLGDWMVDRNKLPNGVPGLVKAATERGIKFGIWIEPEMANTVSELYEKHPDWIINSQGRDVVQGRGGTQVVLDLSNPAVQDYVFSIVDNLMTENPDIAYIKWDANMNIASYGSSYLPKDRQSELYIRYHRGFKDVCERIRAKYPDLTIQACASGGARANYGVLPYFDEFWVSDDTDALQRIYLQWGTSYFFPAIAMASHISASPNHQTQRVIPIKFRIDVAMSGRLGMEIQPKNMTPEEIEQCKTAIADYKKVRPVVQFGDIYRLISPYDHKGLASLMYADADKDEAVLYMWKTEHFMDQHLPRVKLAGLDPDRTYTLYELDKAQGRPSALEGKSFSGAYLMSTGIDFPSGGGSNAYYSHVYHLVAE